MPYENYDTGYQFSSRVAQKCCIEAVGLASRSISKFYFSVSDRDIAIRNLNIELLQEHMRHMKNDAHIRQAHKTIAHLLQLNLESQAEGGLL